MLVSVCGVGKVEFAGFYPHSAHQALQVSAPAPSITTSKPCQIVFFLSSTAKNVTVAVAVAVVVERRSERCYLPFPNRHFSHKRQIYLLYFTIYLFYLWNIIFRLHHNYFVGNQFYFGMARHKILSDITAGQTYTQHLIERGGLFPQRGIYPPSCPAFKPRVWQPVSGTRSHPPFWLGLQVHNLPTAICARILGIL